MPSCESAAFVPRRPCAVKHIGPRIDLSYDASMYRALLVLCFAALGSAGLYVYQGWTNQPMIESTQAVEEAPKELTYEEKVAAEVDVIKAAHPDELLADLIPMPGRDLQLVRGEDGDMRLLFSTTYLNQGLGTMELRADPKTAGIRADIDRDVYQRIYKADGSYREKVVGNFLWHQEHLHYHYADFIVYDLMSEDRPDHPELTGILQKSTFCLRDISRVLSPVPGKQDEATYKICGKEKQGVSVGWGDTYYYNYPDQALNIEALESGTYRLTFIANPEKRLDELAYSNNTSYVRFTYNKEARSLSILDEFPKNLPEIEHVHLDDPFGL